MSYLETVAAKLEELMRTRGFSEETRHDIETFFREKVLESFRNGVEKGSTRAEAQRGAAQSTKPAPRRAWKPTGRTR